MKILIKQICNDENYPRMIMDVLKHVHILDDHDIKKLLFLYWEIVEKTKPDGTIKDEITLACNAFRSDLLSANEFVWGWTLRLISKINIKTVLETCIAAINENLKHRHFYVRWNAVMCLFSIFKNSEWGIEFLENSVDEINNLLLNEKDISTKRNAFILLYHID